MIATGVVYRWELARRGKPMTVDVPGSIVVNDIGLMVALAIEGRGARLRARRVDRRPGRRGPARARARAVPDPWPGFCLYFPARMQEQPKLKALVEAVKHMREGPLRPGPQ